MPVVIMPTGGQRANVEADLASGDGRIEFNNFAALGVDVEAGSGNDQVRFINVTAYDGIDVEAGSGDDQVLLDYVDIHKGLEINTASGREAVTFGATGTGVTVFSGGVNIQGASGKNILVGRANLHADAADKVKIKKFDIV